MGIFKVLLLSILVSIVILVTWKFVPDVTLAALVGFTALLGLFYLFGFPDRTWLRVTHVESIRLRLGRTVYNSSITPPTTVRQIVERLPMVGRFSVAEMRVRDTDDFIDECEETLGKGFIFYVFVSGGSIVGYFQVQHFVTTEAAETLELVKLYGPYIYLGLSLGWICWIASPAFLHRRRNHAVPDENAVI